MTVFRAGRPFRCVVDRFLLPGRNLSGRSQGGAGAENERQGQSSMPVGFPFSGIMPDAFGGLELFLPQRFPLAGIMPRHLRRAGILSATAIPACRDYAPIFSAGRNPFCNSGFRFPESCPDTFSGSEPFLQQCFPLSGIMPRHLRRAGTLSATAVPVSRDHARCFRRAGTCQAGIEVARAPKMNGRVNRRCRLGFRFPESCPDTFGELEPSLPQRFPFTG